MNTAPIPSALGGNPVWSVEAFRVKDGPKMVARAPDLSLVVEVCAPVARAGAVGVYFSRYSAGVGVRPASEWAELLTVARELVRRITEGK